MRTKISISVLLIILLTSFMTVFGQVATEKNKQEKSDQKSKDSYTVIVETKKDVKNDIEKALQESLVAKQKSLQAKHQAGKITEEEYLKETQELAELEEKLKRMESEFEKQMIITPDTWNPNFKVTTPNRYYKFDAENFPPAITVMSGHHQNTSMNISKNLEDVTFATDFTYEVKEDASNISFSVSGTLRQGELKITLKKPDKTSFQEIIVSPLADVNWNQQFNWDEDKAADYLGKWTISISANKAAGNYKVQVNSR